MKLTVRTARIGLTNELHGLIERRIRFALSRFSPRISRVSVLIEDVNGARGGIDKRCEVAVSIDRGGELRAEATDAVIEPAIAAAANRIGRTVQRALEMWRDERYTADGGSRLRELPGGALQDT